MCIYVHIYYILLGISQKLVIIPSNLTDVLAVLLILDLTLRVDAQGKTIKTLGECVKEQGETIQDVKSGMLHFYLLELFVT